MVHGVVANRLGVKRRAEWAKCPGGELSEWRNALLD